jgi:hypothetical protein
MKLSQSAKNLLNTLEALHGAVLLNPNESQIGRIKEWTPELCRMRSVPQDIKQKWIAIAAAL